MDVPLAGKVPPRALILGVPIVVGTLVVGSGLAWVLVIQLTSGQATGPRVRTEVSATCDVLPTLVTRLDAFGLEPVVTGTVLTFSMPTAGDDPIRMASVLAMPGELRVNGEVMRPNHAGVQISLQGGAVTLVTLDTAPPTDATATVDGVPLDIIQTNGTELQLAALALTSSEALRLASDRAVALRHPLPCAATLSPPSEIP